MNSNNFGLFTYHLLQVVFALNHARMQQHMIDKIYAKQY
jgi:hypothetical protein